MNAKEHYETHLADFYSWMCGDLKSKIEEQEIYFSSHGIKPVKSSVAIDLGCGHGIQSFALANLGFEVIGVDFNKQLLDELQGNIKDQKITTIQTNIMDFEEYSNFTPEIVTCMGDTITHMTSISDVEKLFTNSFNILDSHGKFFISYRDLSNALTGEQRFIPVKSDENRILTCFLEYHDTHVTTTDLLYEKRDGKWIQKVSSYPKLRIAEHTMLSLLEKSNFEITSHETVNRMIYIQGRKN